MKLLLAVGVVVALFIAFRLAIPKLATTSVAEGVVEKNGAPASLADCPDTPNCAGSESTREGQRVERVPLPSSTISPIDVVANAITSLPRTRIVKQDERYLHATFRTRIMGYVDDVEFLLDESGNSLQVRSASRLGYSDVGANAKRIELLRRVLAATNT